MKHIASLIKPDSPGRPKPAKKAIAVITEGAIFQAYLSKQNQTVEMEKR